MIKNINQLVEIKTLNSFCWRKLMCEICINRFGAIAKEYNTEFLIVKATFNDTDKFHLLNYVHASAIMPYNHLSSMLFVASGIRPCTNNRIQVCVKLIGSNLRDRNYAVHIGSFSFERTIIRAGVLQWTVLGPILCTACVFFPICRLINSFHVRHAALHGI